MTQPISRRSVAKAGVWSAPVIAASAAVPAYAASSRSDDSEEKLTIQSGLFVSAQYGGGLCWLRFVHQHRSDSPDHS